MVDWSPQSWPRVVSAVAIVVSVQTVPVQPVVECTVHEDNVAHIFQVIDAKSLREPRWWLTLAIPSIKTGVIELPLRDARVERSLDAISISATSSNGGLAVNLAAERQGVSTIDVFVNFELEVNVWRDLSPAVEQMNTDGPQKASCRILSTPEVLP